MQIPTKINHRGSPAKSPTIEFITMFGSDVNLVKYSRTDVIVWNPA